MNASFLHIIHILVFLWKFLLLVHEVYICTTLKATLTAAVLTISPTLYIKKKGLGFVPLG